MSFFLVVCLFFYRFNSSFIFAGVEQVRGTTAQNTQRDEPHLELCVSDCLPCVAPGRGLSKSSFHKCQDQATAVTAWLAPAGVLPRRGVGGEGGVGAKTKAAESEEVQIDASFQVKGFPEHLGEKVQKHDERKSVQL